MYNPFYGNAFACYPPALHGSSVVAALSPAPIDTLMISSISVHASESDLASVMNGFAGYKRSKLVNKGSSCCAWVQFEDVPSAEAAMRTLQGSSTLALDAQGLRIAFSKKPMGVPGRLALPAAHPPLTALSNLATSQDSRAFLGKRPRDGSSDGFADASSTLGAAQIPRLSHFHGSLFSQCPASYGGGSPSVDIINASAHGIISHQYAMPYGAYLPAAMPAYYLTPNAHAAAADASAASVPIDTIMIANMSLGTNETDVQTVMYGFAGYKRSKLVNKGSSCCAWVQFEDVPSAEAAMRTLQGSSTLALDAQGLRIAFSKKPMGITECASITVDSTAAASIRAGAPMDTLMISSISVHASESDLASVMNGFAGYKRSKLVNKGSSCCAWVQFEDVPSAEAAMRTLQGSSTLALDAQGLRIAFSKKPMGVAGTRSSS